MNYPDSAHSLLSHEPNAFITKESSHHLLNAIIVPRPIAFVTSMGANGIVNAAPFSYFNIVCTEPSILSLAIEKRNKLRKDTVRNIDFLKEFVINICSIEMATAISIAGRDFPPEISEIEIANLALIDSEVVKVPRIANTFVQLECKLHQIIEICEGQSDLILGSVVKIHVHKDIINKNGYIDTQKLNPIARIAGPTYAKVSDYFDIPNSPYAEK